jgi:hypothetical protein
MRARAMKKLYAVLLSLCIAGAAGALLAQDAPKADKDKKEAAPVSDKKGVEGYSKAKWGSAMAAVKNDLMGKISYTDDKRLIQTRDGDITYSYGFFYKEKPGKDNKPEQETRLFYVNVQFPYLSMKDVAKKLEDQYGAPTGDSVKDNAGYMLWEFEKTTIILWVEQYEKKPFTKKITYMSKDLTKELEDYKLELFNAIENKTKETMKP